MYRKCILKHVRIRSFNADLLLVIPRYNHNFDIRSLQTATHFDYKLISSHFPHLPSSQNVLPPVPRASASAPGCAPSERSRRRATDSRRRTSPRPARPVIYMSESKLRRNVKGGAHSHAVAALTGQIAELLPTVTAARRSPCPPAP